VTAAGVAVWLAMGLTGGCTVSVADYTKAIQAIFVALVA